MLNPAGTTPVLVEEGYPPVPGAAIIAEYLDETARRRAGERRLLPADIRPRASRCGGSPPGSTRSSSPRSRGPLVMERFYKRLMRIEQGGGPPDTDAIRAARINVRYHLAYIGWLVRTRDWLAGDRMTLRRSRRGRASVGGGLSGRCAMDRRRGGEELVRAGEVAPVVPPAAGRDLAGPAAGAEPTPTSISERSRQHQGRADRGRPRARLRRVGIARPDAAPLAKARLEQFLAEGAHGDMDWMETSAERRGDPRALWPRGALRHHARLNYGPDHDPLAILEQRDRGAISVYAQGEDYHEVIKPRLKAIARWLIAQARRRREGVRRHRRRDGEAARGRRRPRLAGQAHQSRVARVRLVAVSRRDLHHARTAAGQRRAGFLRHLPRLPRHLPDRGVSRAVPARCAALHLLSHHRAQGPDPARAARR